VYQDKGIRAQIDLPQPCMVQADPGDLMELLGNLMDNAYKYGNKRVRVASEVTAGGIEIILDDDGAGWPEGQVVQLTQRGHRADQAQAGQGIGLAVVQELVSLYDGELTFSRSSLGGGRITVRLPQRP